MSARAAAAALAAVLAGACGGESETRLVVLGTTDVHGHLLPYEYATGEPADHSLAQVATLVDSIRRAEPHVLLVDSGDLLQGTPLNEFQARERAGASHPVIGVMNALAYDASAIGNHEFNYGVPFLEAALADAEFPFLGANIVRVESGEMAWPAYTIVERGGVAVGIVGLTTPGVLVWDRDHVEDRLDFLDLVDAAGVWVPRAREAGAEVVVVVAHAGLGPGSSYGTATGVPEENPLARLASEVEGIDVIFAGHTREPVAGERIGGTLVLHAGAHADHLAVAELTVRRTTAGVQVESAGRLLPTAGVPPDSAVLDRAREAHEATLAWLDEPIGFTPDRWDAADGRVLDTPIADLVTHVQAEATGAELSAAAIFRTESSFGPGPIDRRDILGLYIYPNTLRAVRISGEDLLGYLERSALYFHTFPADDLVNDSVPGYNFDTVAGVAYAIDLRRPPGSRIVDARIEGRPVAPADSFTLALNNYRQAGGGGYDMVADAPVVHADETDIASRIIAFVAERDTLRVADVHRRNWELRPEAAVRRLLEDGGREE